MRRLGKSCGAALDALEAAGGSATIEQLAATLKVKRLRDLRGRVIARLEQAGVVECCEGNVCLLPDWTEALNRERERAGEISAHRRDMSRYARERDAYRNRHRVVPTAHPANYGGDGLIEDLERVPELPTLRELYPLIGRTVQTRHGPGVLWQCFSDRVGVVLDSDPAVVSFMPRAELVVEEAS